MSSTSPKWKREVLRRLNLLDLNIDPIKKSDIAMEGVEEAEDCELCKNPDEGMTRDGDNSDDPEMEGC